MNTVSQQEKIEQIKKETSRIMHLHYCENDVEQVIETFAPVFSWFGAGEEQYVVGRAETADFFRRFKGAVPKCNITEEHYDVLSIGDNLFICSGMMWIATDPAAEMYLRVHQRVSFVFQWTESKMYCMHIHCSNPYMEMMAGEVFPEKIGKQSYEYVQQSIAQLEEDMRQKNNQLSVIMSSIPGGLKISLDDENYSYQYVSEEAAALFGYTVDEFMAVTGGTAVGAVYSEDLKGALEGCAEDFSNGRKEYAQKYRVRCKDGSLKWILDSGCKSQNDKGETLINSLYLDITKAEEDRQKILQQKELLSSIFNTVPCGILRFRRKNNLYELISINPAAIHLLGYLSEDIFLRDWQDGIADTVLMEDQIILRDSYSQMQYIGDSCDVEYRVRWRDGSIHMLRGSNRIISTSEDTQVVQRIFFDITESKLLQEQLRREREMYRLAMESNSDVMYEYIVDEDKIVTYAPQTKADGNDSVEKAEIFRFQETLLKKGLVYHEDTELIQNLICRNTIKEAEARMFVPGRNEFQWFRLTGRAIIEHGQLRRVVGTMHSIHVEKQALKENRKELHRSQLALQAISDSYTGILYVNLEQDHYYSIRIPEGVKADNNASSEGTFSLLFSDYIKDCVDDDEQEKLGSFVDLAQLRQVLQKNGGEASLEFCETKNHAKRWLRMEVHWVANQQASVDDVIVTFRNVTEERKRELEHLQEEERAKAVLEEAYESARKANSAKSDFLSKMSHDIRTPMNAVMGMLAIAKKNLTNAEKIADCLEKIELSSEHLLRLINEVLDMSKIENGDTIFQEGVFNFSEIMRNVAAMMQQESESKQQQLIFDSSDLQHSTVWGDMVRVQQILINLVSNAVKYTPEGGHIQVRVQELPASGDICCYQIMVQDDGIGMEESFLKRLFEPFERAVDSRVSKIQGTGLGMFITQNLVEMMNGTIQVKSELNKGSCFMVTIYLKPVDQEAPNVLPVEKQSSKISFTKHWHILLVEDNDLNREIAKELLEMEGLEVDEATDGQKAVEKFIVSALGHYHLILMDLQMPIMNGYDATKMIRGLDRPDAATIPIIALTANAFADDICHVQQVGMNEHLAKPLDVEKMFSVLYQWLEQK